MKAIFKERLLKLADFLDTLPATDFDFSSWVGDGWSGQEFMTPSCGTTACALGWATAIPEFQALGLHIRKDRFGVGTVTVDAKEPISSWMATYKAAEVVFGLNPDQVEWLFVPSARPRDEEEYYGDSNGDFGSDGKPYSDASPSVVADHIREFVEDQEIGE